MVASQNGWRANDRSVINSGASAAGVAFPGGVRRGAPGQLLMAVAERFHSEVEALGEGCWGYAERDIRGSNAVSNHASGTAIDCNAPQHPLGQEGTFSAAQQTAIRRILDDAGGVVRWGGDYSGRKDEMHFEINNGQTVEDCEQALAAVTGGSGTGGTGTTEEDDMIGLQKGDSGQRVKGLQALIQYAGVELSQYGVDGDYGDETAEGLRQVRENVGSQAKSGYGDRVDGWGYAQLMKAVARNNG